MPAETTTAKPLRDDEARLRDYARERRDQATRSATELLERARVTGRPLGDDARRFGELLASSDEWDARMAAYDARSRARTEMANVVREPLTYDLRANPQNSWIADHRNALRNDQAAKDRLERHAREMTIEMRARSGRSSERRKRGDLTQPRASFEYRAPNLGAGQGAEFMPPLWLVDLTATFPRPQRTIADLAPSFPLPSGVSSISIPIIATGSVEQPQAPTSSVASADLASSGTTSHVMLIPGYCDVSLQLLEQSGTAGAALDVVVWRDLLAAYDAQLEYQITSGPGTTAVGTFVADAQLLGIANVPGAGNVTYTSGSPTAIGAYPFLGQAFGTVSNARKVRPECWIMRGGRWVFFVTGEDAEGRPLGVPDAHNPAPTTPDGVPDPVGALVGLPVFTSEAISSTLGPAGNQDEIIAMRPSDCLLWEGEPRLGLFDETLSGSLGARISMWASAAFIGGRLPTGICTLTGTGMTVQTNE